MSVLREQLSKLSAPQQVAFLAGLKPEELEALRYDWEGVWARKEQVPPDDGEWSVFMYLAGRGAGKTRSAAEWVRKVARQYPGSRIAIVARTAADVRDTCIEGESGLLAVHPESERPLYEPSKRRITWRNGSQATAYSADEPDLLRGPQHHFAWADELATWQRLDETWSNLRLGLRLGAHPRTMVTTTPRPLTLIRELLKSPTTLVRRGSTFDNAANLAPSALAEFRSRYENTRLGRQELYAEILDDVPGALWSRSVLDGSRVKAPPDLVRIVVAVDPAATSGEDSDETGIVVAGRDSTGHYYVLSDVSCRLSPDGWARRAVSAFDTWRADRIVAEANQGGEMVESVIRTVRADLPVMRVHASRGKRTRAEPVAALYEQGKVHHVGGFPELEDQMCRFTPDGYEGSPDRVDALVWALSELSGRGGVALQFDSNRNKLDAPSSEKRHAYAVVGCRMGVEGDAVAVLGWDEHSPAVRLISEWAGPKQTMSELAARLGRAIEMHDPITTVLDAGERGSAVLREMKARFGLPLVVMEDRERLAAIGFLDDAIRAGHFLASPEGKFARESQQMEWDRTQATQPRLVGSSAIVEAVLAAFLRARNYFQPPPPPPPAPGTPGYAAAEAKRMEQAEVLEWEISHQAEQDGAWDGWIG